MSFKVVGLLASRTAQPDQHDVFLERQKAHQRELTSAMAEHGRLLTGIMIRAAAELGDVITAVAADEFHRVRRTIVTE